MRFTVKLAASVGLMLLLTMSGAMAQAYPTRPIKIIVPFGAGSGPDIAVRIMADKLKQNTKGDVVVENMAGALGLIGTNYVLRSPADGYTLLMNGVSGHSLGPFISKEVNYDPIKDFTNILRFAVYPFVLVVPANSKIMTLEDLIRDTKENPGKRTWAFSSASGQMTGITFLKQAGIEARQVPYKATPAAMIDLIRGDITFMSVDAASAGQYASEKKIRILAVMGEQRSATLPDVPTVGEAGASPWGGLTGWAGFTGPKGMPANATDWLRTHLHTVLTDAEVVEKIRKTGTEVNVDMNADAWIAKQLVVWEKAAKDAGLTRQ